jgi:hypothetical protein
MKPNPALERIKQIQSRTPGAGMREPLVGADFTNPIIQAAEEIARERGGLPSAEALPPLEEDQDALRVAQRLLQIQAEGVGAIRPTNTRIYTEENNKRDAVEVFSQRINRTR